MIEADEMRRQMKRATAMGARLFRNNVGQAWAGKVEKITKARTVKVNPGDVVIRSARPFHGGLCNGSGDLIGWTPVTITKEMAGSVLAVFTSVEVKAGKGRATGSQVNWANAVLAAGGYGGVSRSDADLSLILRNEGARTL